MLEKREVIMYMFHFQKKGRLMKPKIFSGYLSSVFYAALLSVALPLSAEEAKGVEIHLSDVELQEIFNNPKRSYVYVGREVSAIADIMAELAKLDDNPESLVHGLAAHIEKGFNIGNYDAVAQALEEAEQLLINNVDVLGEEKVEELTNSLNAIIEQVIEEKLNLDAELLSFLKDSVIQEDATKSGCCKPKPHCHGLRLLVIKEKVDFQGKVKFREDVRFKDDVVFEDDVTFEDTVTFEDDVNITGTLSVVDQVIEGDLDIGLNLNLNASTSAAVGNVVIGGVPFMSNFGTNNTFLGSVAGNFTLTGVDNTGIGFSTLSIDADGEGNTAIGSRSLQLNITGDFNTALGVNALQNSLGDFNTALGVNAGVALTTGDNNIYIANDGVAVESNTIRIGTLGSQTRCFVQGISGVVTAFAAIPVLVDANGQLGTTSSSASVKHDIADMGSASDNIMNLRPVTFVYNGDESNQTRYGLIAEEVDQVFPALAVKDPQGNIYSVHYETLPVLLLNEFQKLAARVAALEALNN